ncbi:hypothetical protein [Methylobacterium sp. A54F]
MMGGERSERDDRMNLSGFEAAPEATSGRTMVRRIAAALGTSEDALLTGDPLAGAGDREESATDLGLVAQTAELLEAFGRVTDPADRSRCLAFVREVAGKARP